MTNESRYQILFDPIRLGPVTAPNRFYQVPHCSGMGHGLPRTLAAMRGMSGSNFLRRLLLRYFRSESTRRPDRSVMPVAERRSRYPS